MTISSRIVSKEAAVGQPFVLIDNPHPLVQRILHDTDVEAKVTSLEVDPYLRRSCLTMPYMFSMANWASDMRFRRPTDGEILVVSARC